MYSYTLHPADHPSPKNHETDVPRLTTPLTGSTAGGWVKLMAMSGEGGLGVKVHTGVAGFEESLQPTRHRMIPPS
jgi:hypothetical protein